MTNLLLALGIICCAFLLGVLRPPARPGRRGPSRSRGARLLMALPALLFTSLLCVLILPVGDRETPDPERKTLVYICWPDPSVFDAIIGWLGDRPATLVAARPGDAPRALPRAVAVEPPRDTPPGREGVTLAIALADLRSRIREIEDAQTDVVIVAPRSSDVVRDLAARDQLVKENPWLAPRLRLLTPDDLGISLPIVRIDLPHSVNHEAPKVDGQVLISDAPPAGASIEVSQVSGDPTGATLQAMAAGANHKLSAVGPPNGTAPVRIDVPHVDLPCVLHTPPPGQTVGLKVDIRAATGETLGSAWATVTSESPELTVLLPKGAPSASSSMLDLLTTLSLQHRAVELDLSGAKAADANAGLMDRSGCLLVDVNLSNDQADVLDASLSASLRKYGRAPMLFFVGSAGLDSVPEGWARYMPDAAPRAVSRLIVVMKDSSGSMLAPISAEPGRTMTREQCADLSITKDLLPGLTTRNVASLIRFVVPRDPKGNDAKRPPEVHGKFVDLQSYTQAGSLGGLWELGPQIEALWRLVTVSKEPISDAIIFFDPHDTHGPEIPGQPAPDNSISTADLQRATDLLGRGVRLHLISVGGSNEVSLPDPLKACVNADFGSQDADAIRRKIQKDVFQDLFPRLAVKMSGAADRLIALQAERDSLRDITALPGLRLIAAYRAYAPEATHPDRDRTALWLAHWHAPDVSPLLLRGGRDLGKGDSIPAWWMAVDLAAEQARTPDAETQTRNALASLIIRSISAVAERLSTPPVYWIGDERGGVTPIRDDWKAFSPQPGGLEGRIVHGPGSKAGGAAPIDKRRLDQPRMSFTGLDPLIPSIAQLRLHDEDPRIGDQRVTLPVIGSPTIPITDPTLLRLFGEQAAGAAPSSTSGAISFFIPARYAAVIIGLALAALIYWIISG